MGGFGSGRFHQDGKAVTEHLPSLDVRRLKRKGLLVPGTASSLRWSHLGRLIGSLALRAEAERVLVSTQTPGTDETQNQWISLDQTPCPLGGSRIWFRCPTSGCGRRVALLYMGSSDSLACRHCLQLAYASQREEGYVRAVRKMDRIRDKLDWGPGIISCDRSRPKGMHRRTYVRLVAEHDGLVGQYLAGMTQRVEDMGKSIY